MTPYLFAKTHRTRTELAYLIHGAGGQKLCILPRNAMHPRTSHGPVSVFVSLRLSTNNRLYLENGTR